MEAARRRLKSIAGHTIQSEGTFAHELDSNQPSKSSPSPVVIGGMVLDIVAKPDSPPTPGTTTPGEIRYVSGGVARNVVECMAKLGIKPFMISVVGFDMAGDLLLKMWEFAEISTEGILRQKDITTPIVSSIFDCKGDLVAGVASVHAVEKFLSPERIWSFRHRIYSAPMLLVDANLHPESLEAACRIAAESGTPVWFEPVSVTKSVRIASIVNHITFASPNEAELIAMANTLSGEERFSIDCRELAAKRRPRRMQTLFDLLKPAIRLLLAKGIKSLVVTLGSDGAFLCFREDAGIAMGGRLSEIIGADCPSRRSETFGFHFAAPEASVASVAGAGDCLVGGMISSICSGSDLMQSAAVGIAVAKEAVEGFENVPAVISRRRIAAEAQQILSAAKRLLF